MHDAALISTWLCRLSDSTKKGYSSAITQWASYFFTKLKVNNWRSVLEQLSTKGLIAFEKLLSARVSQLHKNGRAASYINQQLTVLASFLKHCVKLGLLSVVPPMPYMKTDKDSPVVGPTLREFTKVLDEAGLNELPFESVRDTFLLRLHFDLSLRVSEVLSIKVDDIGRNSYGTYIFVRRKYHDKKQMIYLNSQLGNLLHRYTMERSRALKTRAGRVRMEAVKDLFVSFKRGRRFTKLSVNEWQRRIKCYGSQVGIDLTTNKIRHTSITLALESIQRQQMPIESVIAHTGHKTLQSILTYRDRLHRYQLVISNNLANSVISTYHNQEFESKRKSPQSGRGHGEKLGA